MNNAAADLASRLALDSPQEVERLRVAFYESWPHEDPAQFIPQFIAWRSWVLDSTDATRQDCLDRYEQRFGLTRRTRLAALFSRLLLDPGQASQAQEQLARAASESALRVQNNHWNEDSEWLFLATDLWKLGRSSRQSGDKMTAVEFFQRALSVWKASGEQPRLKLAIAALEHEISQCREPPKSQCN